MRNTLSSVENQCLFYYNEVQSLGQIIEHLQDSNLDLEVENFGYVQDVAVLETRLLKYQHLFKSNEGCMCAMKRELMKVQAENKLYASSNSYLKQTLMTMSCDLQTLQMIVDESEEIKTYLQKANEELVHKSEINRQELIRESKVNDVNIERIEELQQILGQKTLELNVLEDKFNKNRKKFELTLCQNNELKMEVEQLLDQIKSYQEGTTVSEAHTGHSHKEAKCCKNKSCDLQDKLIRMKELLQQKCEQYCKLETEFCVQSNTLTCLKQQIEGNNAHYQDDMLDLKHTIQELNEKLTKTENNYQNLHEDYKKSQAQVIETSQHDAKLQQASIRREKDLSQRLQILQKEEARLTECILHLENECSILRKELMNKDIQLSATQEEINTLKNDMNKLIHKQHKLKAGNEKLQTEIAILNSCTSRSEEHSHVANEHLEQCLKELQSVQIEKDHVETKNKQLKKDMQTLQSSHKQLESTYKQLNESVINLQMELVDNKISRNEICEESRCVITNVRSWLHNQSNINCELTKKLHEDANIIEKLKRKITSLTSKYRQRGGGSIDAEENFGFNVTKLNHRVWSPGSLESGCVSPNSATTSINQDWYEDFEDEECIEDASLLSHCLKKVESINHELRKSNQFWQSKMGDNDYLVTKDQ